MFLRARMIAEELRLIGLDDNCIPNCDIALDATHPLLKNRCYGTDAETVIAAARAVAEGLTAGGVLPVMKHLPGHGRALVDSHLRLPVVQEDPDTLRTVDFAPFRALNGLPMAMTAHIRFPALDPDNPATTSATVLRMIREEIGFRGLLMTDDISMEALSGDVASRSAAARAAGCDIVLHCNGRLAEMTRVVAATGALDGAAAARAQAALVARTLPQPIDIAAAEAEFDGLLTRSRECSAP